MKQFSLGHITLAIACRYIDYLLLETANRGQHGLETICLLLALKVSSTTICARVCLFLKGFTRNFDLDRKVTLEDAEYEKYQEVLQVVLLPTCCGSLCKYLMVASGRASVFILRARVQIVIKVWDHAVGMICVHEAGGKVSDWKGSQLELAADHIIF
ncbi:unnamed protein product [Victoria cruziana]